MRTLKLILWSRMMITKMMIKTAAMKMMMTTTTVSLSPRAPWPSLSLVTSEKPAKYLPRATVAVVQIHLCRLYLLRGLARSWRVLSGGIPAPTEGRPSGPPGPRSSLQPSVFLASILVARDDLHDSLTCTRMRRRMILIKSVRLSAQMLAAPRLSPVSMICSAMRLQSTRVNETTSAQHVESSSPDRMDSGAIMRSRAVPAQPPLRLTLNGVQLEMKGCNPARTRLEQTQQGYPLISP